MTRIVSARVEACGLKCPYFRVGEGWALDRCAVWTEFSDEDTKTFGRGFPEWCPLEEEK